MSADDIEIRRPAQEDPADSVLYRSIRVEALQANPEAFGSTFEVEDEKPMSWSGSTRTNDYSHYRSLAIIIVDDCLVGDAAAQACRWALLKIGCTYNTTLAPNESSM